MSGSSVITLFQKDVTNKMSASTNTDMKWFADQEQTAQEYLKDPDKTIFKSELLKSRLIELEKEIDIFRKENATLSVQRQKLQEDYVKLHKEFKKKEKDFEDAKRRVEDRLNEEKKKLAREKMALESRIRDSQEKAQQNKIERQEIQSLKHQLMQLTEEMNNKESRWNAAQSRHRSQVRILRSENIKLKDELEKLQNSKKSNVKTRKPGHISNAKAIHQINKQLNAHARQAIKPPKSLVTEDKEMLVEPMMEAVYPETNLKKSPHRQVKNLDIESKANNAENITQKEQKAHQSLENVARKRNLYDHLLKDATACFFTDQDSLAHRNAQNLTCNTQSSIEDQTDEKHPKNIQSDLKPSTKLLNNNYDKTNVEQNHNCQSTPVSVKKPLSTLEDNNDSSHTLKLDASWPSEMNSANKQDVKRIQHPDGRIEYWYANGNVKKVFPDQGVSKMIYYNGDVRETDKDGKVRYFYASTRTWHTTMPDGLEILEFPDGQIERRSLSGTVEICFPDGSVRTLKSDGTEKWALPDETIVETFANGEKVLTLPNGQREIHTAAHKRREYPDGTVKLVYPDGTQVTRYSNGRTRLKDKEGNLLMDSY